MFFTYGWCSVLQALYDEYLKDWQVKVPERRLYCFVSGSKHTKRAKSAFPWIKELVPALLSISEQENGILTRYLYRALLLFLYYLVHIFRLEIISDLLHNWYVSLYFPRSFLLYLLCQPDLAWARNQGWVAKHTFLRSHTLPQKF